MEKIVKCFIVIFLLNLSIGLKAQVKIEFKVSVFEGTPRGARVVAAPSIEEKKSKTYSVSKNGDCDVNIPYNDLYTLRIEKEGYVTKIIEVNSDVPESVITEGSSFSKKKIEITLYPEKKNVDVGIFKQPVIKLAYDRSYDDFIRDTDYEDALKGRANKVESDLKIPSPKSAEIASAEIPKSESAINKPVIPRELSSNKLVVAPPKKIEKKEVVELKPKPKKKLSNSKKKKETSSTKSKYKPVYPRTDRLELAASNDVYMGTKIPDNLPYIEQHKNLNSIQLRMIDEQYDDLIKKAEEAFKSGNFLNSRFFYNQAIYLKGKDNSIAEKLGEIDVLINERRMATFNKEFKYFIDKGEEYYNKKSYSISRYFYNLAQEMKPDDEMVNGKLKDISTSLGR